MMQHKYFTLSNAILVCLGALVLTGWYLQIGILIQIHPSFVPMQYNTALCFLLIGASYLLFKKAPSVSFFLASIVALLPVLTLCQYIFGVNFGIDELFMQHDVTTKTSHPGRMAPNTALCFMLSALCLYCMAKKRPKHGAIITGILLALSLVASFGYLSGIETAHGWGKMTSMALHTSLGFLILGCGSLSYFWNIASVQAVRPEWIPQVVLIAGLSGSVILWQAANAFHDRFIKKEAVAMVKSFGHQLNTVIDNEIISLRRMVKRWDEANNDKWVADATQYMLDFPFYNSIDWINEDGGVTRVTRGGVGVLQQALTHKKQKMLEGVSGQEHILINSNGPDAELSVFLRIGKSEQFIVGNYDLQSIVESVYSESTMDENISINLSRGGLRMVAIPGPISDPFFVQQDFKIQGELFSARFGTLTHFDDDSKSMFSMSVLLAGILLSFAVFMLMNMWASLADKKMQLEGLIDELTSSNADLERFAYIASHDLQEPLRMMTSFTQLLKEKGTGVLDKEADQYIDFTYDAAVRMQQIIRSILEYSRVSSDSVQVNAVDLNDVLSTVELNLAQKISESGANISRSELPKIDMNHMQAVQLFQNLVLNAMHYQNPGNKPIIKITSSEDESKLVIQIEDNGIGIDPDYQEKVFEPFQRLHTYSQYTGSGIGLSLCRKIVENAGGSLSVHSTLGSGATFIITFYK